MKTLLIALFGFFALASIQAEEEKPQAVYEFTFEQNVDYVRPSIKVVEGNSTTRLEGTVTPRGTVDFDGDNRPVVKFPLRMQLQFSEWRNKTRRYVFKGEIACDDPKASPLLQATSEVNGQGESAHFIWKDDRETPDSTLNWKPFELSCAFPDNFGGSDRVTFKVSLDKVPDKAAVFLRRLQLVEYGAPFTPADSHRRETAPEPTPILSPAPPPEPALPPLSLHTLRSPFGLSWIGVAAGAGVAGGLLGGGVLALVSSLRERRRRAQRERELQRIASLDAVER